MRTNAVKFSNKKQAEFFKDLRKRVDNYFHERKFTKYTNANMKFKTIFLLAVYFVPILLMLTNIVSGTPRVYLYLMWVLMGFGMSGIGLSIIHDANYGHIQKDEKNITGFIKH